MQESRSSDRSVTLAAVSEATAGRYKCEVMTEAPAFKTAVMFKNLSVIGGVNLVKKTVSHT